MHAANTIRLVAAAVLTLAASGAQAAPRDTASFANVAINGAAPVSRTATLIGGYTAKFVTVSGALTRPSGGTSRASEAIIQAISPDGKRFTIEPFADAATVNLNGFLAVTNSFTQKLPAPINVAPGAWTFRFMDTQDQAGTIDATWSNISITFNDGPPATVADFGTLQNGQTSQLNVPLVGGVSFIRFTIEQDAASSAGRFLDIDTEGTAANGGLVNPRIAVFNEDGRQVAFDDDDGAGANAQLTFGIGLRAPVGNGLSFDGRDGTLPAGTYFLAVAGAGATFGGVGWSVNTTSASIGPIHVRIRSNTARPLFCPGDFNRDGVVNQSDLNAFTDVFIAGCL